jgi:hypothetical protein
MDSMPERDVRAIVVRIAAYAWAAPNTALGAVFGLVMLCLGGRVCFVSGAAEFQGGLVARAIVALPGPVRFGAITFGHVILGISHAKLCACREHEHVHVRQYERWGPFFLPAYIASSLWQIIRGRRAYRDNYFERQAFDADADRTRPPSP